MRRPQRRNRHPRLRKARRILRVRMHHPANRRETRGTAACASPGPTTASASPSTTLPSRSVTTMCSGRRSSYSTPDGLITTSPRSRSTPEALPNVYSTSPGAPTPGWPPAPPCAVPSSSMTTSIQPRSRPPLIAPVVIRHGRHCLRPTAQISAVRQRFMLPAAPRPPQRAVPDAAHAHTSPYCSKLSSLDRSRRIRSIAYGARWPAHGSAAPAARPAARSPASGCPPGSAPTPSQTAARGHASSARPASTFSPSSHAAIRPARHHPQRADRPEEVQRPRHIPQQKPDRQQIEEHPHRAREAVVARARAAAAGS